MQYPVQYVCFVRILSSCLIVLVLVLTSSLTATAAGPGIKHMSDEERQQYRAEQARERASRRVESRTGYPTVYEDELAEIQQDFMALSQQIARIGMMLQAMSPGRSAGPGFMPAPIYGAPGGVAGPLPGVPGQHPLAHIYGPEGPSTHSVRVILEYRLMVMGNPRLKVGEIKDQKDNIRVQVVTVEGSLVEEYLVNKKTGYWHLKR